MEGFFLFCFAFGALFTLASTLLGMLGAGLHGLGAHVHLPGVHVRGGTHGVLSQVFNPSAMLAALTAFGGLGYLGVHHLGWAWPLALGAALVAGLLTHGALAALYHKLQQDAGTMFDQDYELTGTPAAVNVSIPAGRCGEIMFPLNGVMRSEAARSLEGQAIAKGSQVVIVGYQQGVAIVQEAGRLLERPAAPPQRQQDAETENG